MADLEDDVSASQHAAERQDKGGEEVVVVVRQQQQQQQRGDKGIDEADVGIDDEDDGDLSSMSPTRTPQHKRFSQRSHARHLSGQSNGSIASTRAAAAAKDFGGSGGDLGDAHDDEEEEEGKDGRLGIQALTNGDGLSSQVGVGLEQAEVLARNGTSPDEGHGKLGHRRLDSVPPQRYDIESTAVGPALETSSAPSSVPRYLDYDGPAGSTFRTRSGSEIEDAGLDFVDINLGVGGAQGSQRGAEHSPYGAGARAASRSALEIRQDSLSSTSPAVQSIALAAEQREQQQQELQDASADSQSSPQSKHAEGRYRGRLSQPSSRDVSPSSSRRHSLSNKVILGSGLAGISLTVAGEDGEISATPGTSNGKVTISEAGREAQSKRGREGETHNDSRSEDQPPTMPTEGEVVSHSHAGAANSVIAPQVGSGEQATGTSLPLGSPTLTDAADGSVDKAKEKRRRESAGVPSALEQHLSRTRMTTLPPKPKKEDVKHLHDFEAMMKQSREMERKRLQEEDARRTQRDDELRENMKVWEADILPSWTRARREAKLRKLWWKGVPPNLRGRIWALACGNNQMLPRNLFAKASKEAHTARKSGAFPQHESDAIEKDIEATLPTLRLFQREIGALHDDLFDILCAFTIFRLDQLRAQKEGRAKAGDGKKGANAPLATQSAYVPGTASLAAMLLINLAPSEALIALLNLIAEKPWLRAIYSLAEVGAFHHNGSRSIRQHPSAGFERVFDTLLADQWPKVYANLQARGVRPSAYVSDWIRTLFVPHLPLNTVARLWDCILLEEGDALLFRAGIAVFSLLSARLYVPDKAELVSILRGNNRAAISVWNRFRSSTNDPTMSPTSRQRDATFPTTPSEGKGPAVDSDHNSVTSDSIDASRASDSVSSEAPQSPRLLTNGPAVEAPDDIVPRDDIYGGQYGITEAMVFRTLEEQDSWWKNSTLERLLDRELVS